MLFRERVLLRSSVVVKTVTAYTQGTRDCDCKNRLARCAYENKRGLHKQIDRVMKLVRGRLLLRSFVVKYHTHIHTSNSWGA